MCALPKCTHTQSSGQPMLWCLGSSWEFVALLKGLTSVMVLKLEQMLIIHSPTDNSCRSRGSNPQPQVTSMTLYPLGHDCPFETSLLTTFCLNFVHKNVHCPSKHSLYWDQFQTMQLSLNQHSEFVLPSWIHCEISVCKNSYWNYCISPTKFGQATVNVICFVILLNLGKIQ